MNAKVEKGKLILEMPLQTPVRSRTGKSFIVLSTRGFVNIPSDEGENYALSLNLIKKTLTNKIGGQNGNS